MPREAAKFKKVDFFQEEPENPSVFEMDFKSQRRPGFFIKQNTMNKKIPFNAVFIFGVVVIVLVGVLGGYRYGAEAGFSKGQKKGYDDGYLAAEASLKKLQQESADKALRDAAAAANPFSVANPLGSVESDPFSKVKNVLNPF